MIKRDVNAIYFVLFFLFSTTVSKAADKNVLFFGNSFISTNNLPKILNDIATSLGDTMEFETVALPAYRLYQHANSPTTPQIISKKDWDFVVFQEQSQLPEFEHPRLDTEVLPYSTYLNNLVHNYWPDTKVIFFMTWGYKEGDKLNCEKLPEVCTYAGMQSRVSQGYTEMATKTGATVAPIGLVWKKVKENYPQIELYASDGIHPSLAGSYLAASVLYLKLFRKNILNATAGGLDSSQAKMIRQVAQEEIQF